MATAEPAADRRPPAPACVVVPGGGGAYRGAQGLDVFEGISARTAGARGLCLHRLELPPGARARPHLHEGHETAIHVLDGSSRLRWGPELEEDVEVRAGEFLYIPAGMPHAPYNPSATASCTVLVARTDPDEQESVVLLDDPAPPGGTA